MYSYILKYQISVAIQYSRASFIRFCRDVATVDKWSIKTTQIQDLESEIGGVLRGLDGVKLSDVERRLMKLHEEVLERLSDIQRGLEVCRSDILRSCMVTYHFFIEYRSELAVGKAYLGKVRYIRCLQ